MLIDKGKAEIIVQKREGSGRVEDVLDDLYRVMKRHGYVMQIGRGGFIVIGQIDEMSAAGVVGKAVARAIIRQITPDGVDYQRIDAQSMPGPVQ